MYIKRPVQLNREHQTDERRDVNECGGEGGGKRKGKGGREKEDDLVRRRAGEGKVEATLSWLDSEETRRQALRTKAGQKRT